jgi:hypothetical protein
VRGVSRLSVTLVAFVRGVIGIQSSANRRQAGLADEPPARHFKRLLRGHRQSAERAPDHSERCNDVRRARLDPLVLRKDVLADLDALVADEDLRTGDQLADVVLVLVAEGAAEEVRHRSDSVTTASRPFQRRRRRSGREEQLRRRTRAAASLRPSSSALSRSALERLGLRPREGTLPPPSSSSSPC